MDISLGPAAGGAVYGFRQNFFCSASPSYRISLTLPLFPPSFHHCCAGTDLQIISYAAGKTR